jgi:O-antigen ligase
LVALALLLILYNIFLTNTRGSIALAGFVLLLCVLRQIVVITPGRLIALLLMGAGMMYFLPQDIYTRVLDIRSYSANTNTGTMQLRLRFWEAAWTGVTKNWLFGAGMGNQLVVPKYVTAVSPSRISAHNEFLNMLVEVGIIGFALFFATVGVIVHASFKAASILPGRQEQYWFMIAAQIALFAALLDGFQVDVFHFPLKGWWLVAGLSLAMLQMLKDENKKVTT